MLLMADLSASAATIEFGQNLEDGTRLVIVEGQLEKGDESRFVALVLPLNSALVILNSPGGNLRSGIEIGKAIRLKEFSTLVPSNSVCSSSCGLAWLGGVKRWKSSTGLVGFHAAYRVENGQATETGLGNALVGAYLNQLGLSESAIAFVTVASPSSMAWLTPETARAFSIEMEEYASETSPQEPTLGQRPPKVTSGPTSPSSGDFMTWVTDNDIFGFDVSSTPLKTESTSVGSETCEKSLGCKAFTFHEPTKFCYLKTDGRTVVGNTNTTTGFMSSIADRLRMSEIRVLEGTALVGSDYKKLESIGFEDCISSCEHDRACRGFTFSQRQRTCWMKTAAGRRKKDRIASGERKWPWEGVWAIQGGGCLNEPGTDRHPIQLSINAFSGYEFRCDVTSIASSAKSSTIDLSCSGEGEFYIDKIIVRTEGDQLFLKRKGDEVLRFSRCFAGGG